VVLPLTVIVTVPPSLVVAVIVLPLTPVTVRPPPKPLPPIMPLPSPRGPVTVLLEMVLATFARLVTVPLPAAALALAVLGPP
jgi:hypothetical protein